jgi:hypothetical protein
VIIVVLAVAWLVVAMAAALLMGGGIRLADRRCAGADPFRGLPDRLTVDDVLAGRSAQPSAR